MRGTFEYKLSNGSTCTIEAEYECVMENEVFDADGDKVFGQSKPTTTGRCNMVAYVDEKKVGSCSIPEWWNLIDLNAKPGTKIISGLKIGFANSEDAERYEKWISEIIEKGKSDEVKAYEKAEKEKENKKMVEFAQRIIENAENQEDIPAKEEAKRRMKQYNDVVNEDGEGYVPYIVSAEEYEYAKKIIKNPETVSTKTFATVTKTHYNRSAIMKNAWNIYRQNGGKLTFSECLKSAWAVAKKAAA